jgi:hypothetical protein
MCCILLVDSVESMMMHGLANPKFKKLTNYCLPLIVQLFHYTLYIYVWYDTHTHTHIIVRNNKCFVPFVCTVRLMTKMAAVTVALCAA